MRRIYFVVLVVVLFATVVVAQNPRVFITDSKSWEIAGGSGGSSAGFGGGVHGGARPQTAEIIKTFGERCPNVTVNNKQEKADYIVLLDHEGGKGFVRKDNKVAVFNWDGDSIISKSTRSLGNAVEDSCNAITNDWAANGSKSKNRTQAGVSPNAPATSVAPAAMPEIIGDLSISSTPAGADIEIDGNFAGNTPSALKVEPGEHNVRISKKGFQTWERKLKVTGGSVKVAPELEPEAKAN